MKVFEDHLAALCALTLRMLEWAHADLWEAVADGEIERQALVEALSAHPAPTADDLSPTHLADLSALDEADAALLALARAKMKTLGDALASTHVNQRVQKAYGAASFPF